MRVYKLLDLYCCEGGGGMGYHKAGFDVVGVDEKPQPRYPFDIIIGDALHILEERHADFDAFHASPPCQKYSSTRFLMGNDHPDLIDATRAALQKTGKPWVIENVRGAPLKNPTLLCGLMFGLNLYRHRLFESNVILDFMLHPPHHAPLQNMRGNNRVTKDNEIMQICGHFTGVARARKDMQTPWMSQYGMSQAIPPAYTEWIGRQLINALNTMESGAQAYNSSVTQGAEAHIAEAATS